ncbi:O-antigen ligase family protein [Methylophilus flavus]|uniref:O-antigen ligase family protein n=1 Tax=Methylophilus flavus TaxID=640084 RepID=A0ABW3PAY6_9PROT
MSKLTQNKSMIALVLIAILSAMFFGLVSLILVSTVGKHYGYLLALPSVIVIGLLFFFSREFFLLLVILTRSSLDVVFESIKIGSFGLGGVLNALVILIALIMYFETEKDKRAGFDNIKVAWVVFMLTCFLSLFYAPVFLTAFKTFLSYLSYAAMFFIGLYSIKKEDDYRKWVKVIALSTLIPLVYSLLSLAFGLHGVRDSMGEGLRLQGTFPHPNPFAPYLVLMISICFFIYKAEFFSVGTVIRRTLPLYILVLIGLLVMTKTRSAWAACFILFFAYGVLLEKRFLLFVFIAPLFALLIPDIQDRILAATQNTDYGVTGYGKLNSYAWRLKIWHDSISWMNPSHYITGYGLAAFVHYSMDFGMANAFQKATFEINAHNIFIQTFFNLGALGLLCFTYLIYTPVKNLYKYYQRKKLYVVIAILVVVQFLLQGYSDNTWDYLIFEWYFWFFIGITLSYLKLVDKRKLIEENNND